jgi:undecaprenyl diphosphate synthase
MLTDTPQKSYTFFTPEQLLELDLSRIPKHVAIIPDGNRRWAKMRKAPIEAGHKEGANVLFDIVKAAQELGVRALTVYSFSTENWNRSPLEVQALMQLINSCLRHLCEPMIQHGVRLCCIGELSRLPNFLIKTLEEIKEATKHCHKIDLVLALNYGGRDELRRAFQVILKDYENGKFKKEEITERLIARYLDTNFQDDPDLLIRTSGEMRISNFLIWQTCYTEVFVSQVLWPDFTPYHLLEAILDYQKRDRRLGGS